VDEFFSTERDFRNYDKKAKNPNDPEQTEPVNLGMYLNDFLNSPEGWRLVSLLPSGMGRAGVLLQRSVPIVLPDPKPLKKETEVAAPTDPELQKIEDDALAFAAEEGLTPPEIEEQTEPAVEARPTLLIEQAIELNGPADRDPTAKGVHREEPLAPAAAAQATAALSGEDFEKTVDEEGNVQ
jgi:hypothetical protein